MRKAIKNHEHKLKKVKYGQSIKWFCTLLGCRFNCTVPINIIGDLVTCGKCSSIFRVDKEDIKQKEGLMLCPICNPEAAKERIEEMEIINEAYRDKAIELLSESSTVSINENDNTKLMRANEVNLVINEDELIDNILKELEKDESI